MGVLASCALVSLENWKEMLTIDHENALFLANELKNLHSLNIEKVIETNIFRI